MEPSGLEPQQNEDKHFRYPGFEHANELHSRSFLQAESAVEVLNEDIFDEKSDLEEEHTTEKAIIQNDVHGLNRLEHPQSDIDSFCSSYGTQISICKSETCMGGLDKNRMVAHMAASEIDNLQAKTILMRPQNDIWQECRAESSLVHMLWRQIEDLALKEKEVEQTLSKERIENLVSKVEEEVEFEGMVEDMCLRFRAEGEFLDIERRKRDWEHERREVRLEEEVQLLRNKVETLEEAIRIAHAEKEYAVQKNHELIHNTKVSSGSAQGQQISGSYNGFEADEEKILTVVKAGHLELADTGREGFHAALREVLCQVEEKAERDRKVLEDTFQDEQKSWIENEQQLQNQISALENELNCVRDTLKEKESVISLERERRRHYGLEVDKVLAFWREENSKHNAVHQRSKNVEVVLARLRDKIKRVISLSPAEEQEIQELLTELLKDLAEVDNGKLEFHGPSNGQELFEWELVERWKVQRDLLEEERDKLQEKLELATEKARENERRLEKLWQEKEMSLVKQLRNLEALVVNDNVTWNETNMTALREKGMWECEVAAYKQAWQEEREKVQVMMAEREQVLEEHTQEWTSVLDVKEEELCSLRSAHKKLGYSLMTSKKRLLNLKRQLVKHRKATLKDSNLKVHTLTSNLDNNGGLCSDESDLEMSCSTDLSDSRGCSRAADGDEEYIDAEQLAYDISKEIGRLAREIRQEQDRLDRERTDVRIGTQQLKDERKELENKVADALSLMEDLREQIKAKEGQMEGERKQMDLILNSKTAETEHLKALLTTKDHEFERSVEKFKDEMSLIQKEVEKERKEREDVMDMHFTSRRKLVQEMKEKEVRCEKEMEAMLQEVEELKRELNEKNQLILKLKKDLKTFELDAEQEKPINDNHLEDLHGVELLASGHTQRIGFHKRGGVEWQDVIGKIAGFDKQIAEAMLAIESLKEELNAKEKELQRARLEKDSERNSAWLHEQAQTREVEENIKSLEMQRDIDWGQREQILLRDNEDLMKLLEAERTDTADAMSILQGAVRELQWALKHSKGKEDITSFELDRETQSFSIKGELVKVHSSHLQELDRYILDLQLKVEEAEKRARTAEVALAVNSVKEAAKGTGTASALVKVRNDWMDNNRLRKQDDTSPAIIGRGWSRGSDGSQGSQQSISGRQENDVARRTLRNGKHDQRWSGGLTEHVQLWDVGTSSPGLDASSSSSSSGWMTVRGATDDSFIVQDPFQQTPLTLAVSTPPPRSQRRWLVDALWLENVRKDQTSLRQQLDIERQRVSALKQVESENRWMEATIIQVLEQKKDGDTRVLELERKVAFLESMIGNMGGHERSPTSSTIYRGAKI